MKLFECQHCGQVLYFENSRCERCRYRLGYIPEEGLLSALERTENGDWSPVGRPEHRYRFCTNAEHDVCNWLVPAGTAEPYCVACRHNATIPDLSDPRNLLSWRKIEAAKHRLFYTLLKLGLPLATHHEDPAHGLVFHFLADTPGENSPKVMTGHDNGAITVALAEADDVEREKRRNAMGEPYRTLLGHFRHEVGHHYWDLLVRDGGRVEDFRALFGDERSDYGEALKRHYAEAPPPDWQTKFVSTYASSHPWEDFAETWAHYLHIVDTLEMAAAFGLTVRARTSAGNDLTASFDIDPYEVGDIQSLVDAWLPLTFALNSLNQTMGQTDLYPFVLSPAVIGKLGFIQDLVRTGPRAELTPSASDEN
jgi:hypothetical protein